MSLMLQMEKQAQRGAATCLPQGSPQQGFSEGLDYEGFRIFSLCLLAFIFLMLSSLPSPVYARVYTHSHSQ